MGLPRLASVTHAPAPHLYIEGLVEGYNIVIVVVVVLSLGPSPSTTLMLILRYDVVMSVCLGVLEAFLCYVMLGGVEAGPHRPVYRGPHHCDSSRSGTLPIPLPFADIHAHLPVRRGDKRAFQRARGLLCYVMLGGTEVGLHRPVYGGSWRQRCKARLVGRASAAVAVVWGRDSAVYVT